MKRYAMFLVLFMTTNMASAATFTFLATGGKSITNWHGQAAAQSVAFEWTDRQWRSIELGLSIEPRVIVQPRSWFGNDYNNGNATTRALAASILARRHFRSGAVRPYLEVLIGPMWASERVPAATSHFNVVTQPGAGITFSAGRLKPVVGYRFAHISNGGLASRNPGWNVSELVVGLRMK